MATNTTGNPHHCLKHVEVDSRLVNMKPERDPTQRDNTMKLNDDLAPSNLRNLQRAHLI